MVHRFSAQSAENGFSKFVERGKMRTFTDSDVAKDIEAVCSKCNHGMWSTLFIMEKSSKSNANPAAAIINTSPLPVFAWHSSATPNWLWSSAPFMLRLQPPEKRKHPPQKCSNLKCQPTIGPFANGWYTKKISCWRQCDLWDYPLQSFFTCWRVQVMLR